MSDNVRWEPVGDGMIVISSKMGWVVKIAVSDNGLALVDESGRHMSIELPAHIRLCRIVREEAQR